MEKTTIANRWHAASVDCDPMGVNRIGMPIGVAAAHAIQQADANPGCLVRVYYKTVDECLDLSDLIWGALDSLMRLDEHHTHENLDAGKILFEVINGSGIELLLEDGDRK